MVAWHAHVARRLGLWAHTPVKQTTVPALASWARHLADGRLSTLLHGRVPSVLTSSGMGLAYVHCGQWCLAGVESLPPR